MNKFYDIDLPFGEIYETKLKYILGNKKIEVKTERDIWKTTNNICIELEYKNNGSGLNTTQADYWCHIFQDNGNIQFIMIFPVQELRKRVQTPIRQGKAKLEYGGDNKDSLVALIPKHHLLD
jgi:hypothetical protein